MRKEKLFFKLSSLNKDQKYNNTLYTNLQPYVSPNKWSTEIITFSIFVGFIFDFLLWLNIFTDRFDFGSLSVAAARASAVVTSLSYAYVCSQLGVSFHVAQLAKKRSDKLKTNSLEKIVFHKHVSRNTFYIWSFLFVFLSIVSIVGRFTSEGGSTADHVLLSMVTISIALVIAGIGYQYHDIYSQEIRFINSKKLKNEKLIELYSQKIDDLDIQIKQTQWVIDNKFSTLNICPLCDSNF